MVLDIAALTLLPRDWFSLALDSVLLDLSKTLILINTNKMASAALALISLCHPVQTEKFSSSSFSRVMESLLVVQMRSHAIPESITG